MANLKRQLFSYSSTSLLAAFVGLALVAGILHRIYPPFGALVALLSVACLLGAVLLPMFSRGYGSRERRWRGQVIDLEPRRIRRPFSWRYAWWRIRSFFGWR